MGKIFLDISGLGIILYSPPAVKHILDGADYFREHFWKAADVARHVMACQLTTFCTGTPGTFHLRFLDGPRDDKAVETADFAIRLGLQVHDDVVCVRDLYDLMRWSSYCSAEQRLQVANGWYRLTVYTTCPESGIFGDNQIIDIHMESVTEKPVLRWQGTPYLCE